MPPEQERWHRDALPRGTVVNGFRVIEVIGQGGFGIVYEARDNLDQPFAVKECFPRDFVMRDGPDVVPQSQSPEYREIFEACRTRFMREGRALVQLGGADAARDGVVKVIFAFEAHRTGYLVMELLGGHNLENLIKASPQGLPADQLGELMHNVLAALAGVHAAGLLHRDLKPANIALRENGRPVLIDFGAVREVSHGQTTIATKISTRGFTPIEQSSGLPQGPMSDLYAFGATFYQAIGGALEDAEQRERAVRRERPDPLRPAREVGAGRYPDPILAAIDAALRIEPEDRPQSVRDLLALLAGAGSKNGPERQPQSDPKPPPAARRNMPIAAVAVTALLLVAGVALAIGSGWLRLGPQPSQPAKETPLVAKHPDTIPRSAAPADPSQRSVSPAPDPTATSAAQVERERQVYAAARGNRTALRSYLDTCEVCAMKPAALAEIEQLYLGEQERQQYQSGRGNLAALRRYVNSCQICQFANAARNEIRSVEERPAFSPPAPCGGNADDRIVQPIRLLYQAVNQKDISLYAAQWADDAVFRDIFAGIVRNKEEKIKGRKKVFAEWEIVRLSMDRAPEIITKTADHAEIKVTYSMTFKKYNQRPLTRNGVIEKYTVTCGPSGKWLIRENVDEINVSGPPH